MKEEATNRSIADSELLIRYVLMPKDLVICTKEGKDEPSYRLATTFITQRNAEKDVSFFRHDYLGHDCSIENGMSFCNALNKRLEKKGMPQQTFYGWAEGTVKSIKDVAPDTIRVEVLNPESNPAHASVLFYDVNGKDLIKGITHDVRIIEMFHDIRNTLTLKQMTDKVNMI